MSRGVGIIAGMPRFELGRELLESPMLPLTSHPYNMIIPIV